jgi:hypothetical protein
MIVENVLNVDFLLETFQLIAVQSMDVKCVTCTRKFKDRHALKSHQPKCRGRANALILGFRKVKWKAKRNNSSGGNVAQGMNEPDDSEPPRKRKKQSQAQVGVT